MIAEDRELIPTRQTLLSRLKDKDNQESWREFFDTYWRLIYATAIKSGLSDAEAQDVVQETVIRVARTIPEFDYNPAGGSFKKWLLNLTHWRIADQIRNRQPGIDCEGDSDGSGEPWTDTMEHLPDPAPSWIEAYWNEEWEQNIAAVAIERVKRKVDPKQYQIFDLSVLREWPAKKVAEILHISAARVYMVKNRVASVVKLEIKKLEKQDNPHSRKSAYG